MTAVPLSTLHPSRPVGVTAAFSDTGPRPPVGRCGSPGRNGSICDRADDHGGLAHGVRHQRDLGVAGMSAEQPTPPPSRPVSASEPASGTRVDPRTVQGVTEAREGPLRLAYADPPYLGCCKLYGHEHNDGGTMPWDGRCWDEIATHAALIQHLDVEFDGWAYSMTSQSLRKIVPATDDVAYRIASWVKPFAAFKRNVRIAYTWEPILFAPGRDRSKDGAPVGRDHIAESITLRRGLTGAKPAKVNRWVLDLMGYVDGDEVTDLFPGTGGMDDALRTAVLA